MKIPLIQLLIVFSARNFVAISNANKVKKQTNKSEL